MSADLEQLTAGESEAEILGNLKYMVIGQKQDEGAPATRALITFAGQRTGIASWLDTPTPIGALDFVSSEASIVSAFAAHVQTECPAADLEWTVLPSLHLHRGKLRAFPMRASTLWTPMPADNVPDRAHASAGRICNDEI